MSMHILILAALIGSGDTPLQPTRFVPLATGAIKPAGWLEKQLKIQAAGFSGHLDEFWPDIQKSAWFGGDAEGWERVPYWLDGIVPLAYQLDDKDLQAKVKRAFDYILEHQQADGWLGPVGDNNPRHKPYDVWPLFPLFKALIQYQEATGDERVVPALVKCAKKIDQVITKEPLYSWAHFRAADFAISVYWLYDKTGDSSLVDLARKVMKQAYDWRAHFEHFADKYSEKTTKFGLDNHGVNNGMALKYGPVRWRLSGDEKDRDLTTLMLAMLDRYHGQATGTFTCDEHYAGRAPSQGTELCTVVESMYSLALGTAATGDIALADRWERLAYNALPATFKKDMTAHQYDQQCNQVLCTRDGEHVYVNNGPDSNLYGLEPNFGCCTANMHQGWPKFVANLWMKSNDGGLAAIGYAPCHVKTEINEKPVEIDVKTEYPFRNVVFIKVTAPQANTFPVYLRLPKWSTMAHILFKDCVVNVDGERVEAPEGGSLVSRPGGSFLKVDATWEGETTFVMEFRDPIELYHGFHDSVAVVQGPLVFALPLAPEWKCVNDRDGLVFDDWEVSTKTPWNYALQVDRDNPETNVTVVREKRGDVPFLPDTPTVRVNVKGRRLRSWAMEKGAAAPPPQSPVSSDEPLEDLTLVPYGTTDLRITEFPILSGDTVKGR